MSKQMKLWAAWAALYILCGVFGFIPAGSNFLVMLEVALAIGFFVPPALLLCDAIGAGRKQTLLCIRNLSFASLGLSFGLLVLNFLSVYFSEGVGIALYYLLILVSVPMTCSQFWLGSLFIWACLMMVCLQELRKIRKAEAEEARLKAEKQAQKKARRNR